MSKRIVVACLACAVALVFLATADVASGQASAGTEAARAELARAGSLFIAKDYDAALAAFARAVEVDPAWPEAHRAYQNAARQVTAVRTAGSRSRPDAATDPKEVIRAQYEAWMTAHPKTAGYVWAYADMLPAGDGTKTELCRRALAIDPRFAPAYRTLANTAAVLGEWRNQVDFLRKAAEAEPGSPSYQQAYIGALWPLDAQTARALSIRFLDRFASDPRAAEVLLGLAAQSDDIAEKTGYLERLRERSGMTAQTAMPLLYALYLSRDTRKAVGLAEEMAAKASSSTTGSMWSEAAGQAATIVRVRDLIERRQFDAALSLVAEASMAPPKAFPGSNPTGAARHELAVLRAEAEAGAGRADAALAQVVRLFVRNPGDRLYDLLLRLGSAAGKTGAETRAAIRERLVADSTPAPDFAIVTYRDGRKGSLSDLRGKVVLLNFWFPT